jgi:triphosphoribosyl-dephospho-CoA synthase
MKVLESERLAWAANLACLLELSADKPGNVTWGKEFGDTRFVDFMASAVAVGPAFRQAAEQPVGEVIFQAVRDTGQLANSNTNLGMILLLAPLARAAGLGHPQGLRAGVSRVLAELTVEDAQKAFGAILMAQPGGLGEVDEYDVRQQEVDITLLEAMRLAQERDRIAQEYVTDFALTFELGYPSLARFWAEGHRFSSSIVQAYLTILSEIPDTLIARKKGWEAARAVSERARSVLEAGGAFTDQGLQAVAELDRSLRDPEHTLNPGTTADLMAATLFVFLTEGQGLEHFPDLLAGW